MSEHNVFGERPQESDKVIEQNLETEEEENDERQTTTAPQRMKQQLIVVTAEMVMFITTEEMKPPASQPERKSVEIKLKEGMKPSEVKPYVGNLGGSTQKVMNVVVEALFDKPDSTKKVMNAKKKNQRKEENTKSQKNIKKKTGLNESNGNNHHQKSL
jgi:hypothetical protein